MNINVNKSFGEAKKLQVGIKIDNLLGDTKESVFQSFKADDQYYTFLDQGRTIQMRISYKFF